MPNVRYPGDVAIPTDQPLHARCSLCGGSVVYAVQHRVTHPGGTPPGDGGLLLDPVYKRGGQFTPRLDGLFVRQGGSRHVRTLRGVKGYDSHACVNLRKKVA